MTAIKLRPRRLYLRPADRFVGFGRNRPEQPDLYEAEYRIGWRILVVCRVCLMAEVQRLHAEVDRFKGLARLAGTHVAEGIAVLEQQIGSREPKEKP